MCLARARLRGTRRRSNRHAAGRRLPFPPRGHLLAGAAAQTKKPKKNDPVFRWIPHPTLQVGIVEVALRARLQFDARASDLDVELGDDADRALDVARRRLGRRGTDRPLRLLPGRARDRRRRRSVARRVPELPAVRPGAVSVRQVQGAVQPGREHQRDEPRLRLPIARREHARAGTRHAAGWCTAASSSASSVTSSACSITTAATRGRGRRRTRVRRRDEGGPRRRAAVPDDRDRWPRICSSASRVDVESTYPPKDSRALRGETVFGPRFFTSDYIIVGQAQAPRASRCAGGRDRSRSSPSTSR